MSCTRAYGEVHKCAMGLLVILVGCGLNCFENKLEQKRIPRNDSAVVWSYPWMTSNEELLRHLDTITSLIEHSSDNPDEAARGLEMYYALNALHLAITVQRVQKNSASNQAGNPRRFKYHMDRMHAVALQPRFLQHNRFASIWNRTMNLFTAAGQAPGLDPPE